MFKITHQGSLSKTEAFLDSVGKLDIEKTMRRFGEIGVEALSRATPKDTGKTAQSWSYKISRKGKNVRIEWRNGSVTKDGIPIVILLQYGHGTRNGGMSRDWIS